MGKCTRKTSAMHVTNIFELAHGWQNNGQQKELLNEKKKDHKFPVGCVKME